jgi:hypothetical protein
LVDIPNFKNPVSVESVNSAASLVANHIDNGIVLERRTRSQVHGVRHLFSCGHIVLAEVVFGIQEHHLTLRVDRLEGFWLYTLHVEVELQKQGEYKFGHGSVLEIVLNISAHS